MGENPTTYSEPRELLLSIREDLQSLQATLERPGDEMGVGLGEIRDGLAKSGELETGSSDSREQVDARVPGVSNSFGKQSDASDKEHGDIGDMRCAGEGSKELPSLGTALGTVPKASQGEDAAVGSEVDSTRFNSMD